MTYVAALAEADGEVEVPEIREERRPKESQTPPRVVWRSMRPGLRQMRVRLSVCL